MDDVVRDDNRIAGFQLTNRLADILVVVPTIDVTATQNQIQTMANPTVLHYLNFTHGVGLIGKILVARRKSSRKILPPGQLGADLVGEQTNGRLDAVFVPAPEGASVLSDGDAADGTNTHIDVGRAGGQPNPVLVELDTCVLTVCLLPAVLTAFKGSDLGNSTIHALTTFRREAVGRKTLRVGAETGGEQCSSRDDKRNLFHNLDIFLINSLVLFLIV